jgi:hypothetical protein
MGATSCAFSETISKSMRFFRDDFQIDGSFHERSQPIVEATTLSPVIGRATTLVMAIGCGAVVATVYSNQPMLGIMEAAFPGQVWITDLVPMATQLGFAVGLLLLVPLGCVAAAATGQVEVGVPCVVGGAFSSAAFNYWNRD